MSAFGRSYRHIVQSQKLKTAVIRLLIENPALEVESTRSGQQVREAEKLRRQ